MKTYRCMNRKCGEILHRRVWVKACPSCRLAFGCGSALAFVAGFLYTLVF